jgi:diamine N-acetyltransferase
MRFRNATPKDVPEIRGLETRPEYTLVGSWPEERHLKMLAEHDAVYIVAEDEQGRIAAFAILQGLQSEHKSVELKRIIVRIPNQGIGNKLLNEVAERAFGEYGAHRLFLDVFVINDRARHVYRRFGFREEGIMREAFYRDGAYHSQVLMSLLESEYRTIKGGGNG